MTLTAWLAGADNSGKYTTGHTIVTSQPEIYYTSLKNLEEGDVTFWTLAGTANKNGTLAFDTNGLAPGEYIFAMAGQPGETLTNAICSAPGAIRVNVFMYGDTTCDGKINVRDASLLYKYVTDGVSLSDAQLAAADFTKNGVVDTRDAAKLYKSVVQ